VTPLTTASAQLYQSDVRSYSSPSALADLRFKYNFLGCGRGSVELPHPDLKRTGVENTGIVPNPCQKKFHCG
jgi:hypothetical protein